MLLLRAVGRWLLVALRGVFLVLLVIVPVPVVALFFRGRRGDRRPVAARVLRDDER